MKFLFAALVLLMSQIINAQEEYIEEGSTTRAIQECEEISAVNKKNNKRIKAERCIYGIGGVGFDPNNPSVVYYIGEKEIEEEDFLKSYNSQATQSPSLEQGQYKCDGKNGNEQQCLICNCFFETGADGKTGKNISYEERLNVARVVTSRVLNPKFANSVCGVVHERSKSSDTAQFSWIRLAKDNCADSSDNCRFNDATDPNHKINTILSPPTEHDTTPKANLIRSCTKVAQEALRKKKEYFASYYLTHAAEADSTWAQACKEMYPTLDNRVVATDASHVFYRACSEDERVMAGLTYAPKTSIRPKPRKIPTIGEGVYTDGKRPRARPVITPGAE